MKNSICIQNLTPPPSPLPILGGGVLDNFNSPPSKGRGWGLFGLIITLFLGSCSNNFNPKQTFTKEQLQSDFKLMRAALEESHPGVYRYTSRDSMNFVFDKTFQKLDHDMTEREFRATVGPVFSYLRCGHTNIYASKSYAKYYDDKKVKPKVLPLSTYFLGNKLWIAQNQSTDSTLKAGMEILKIDGRPVPEILANMRDIISSDGYNQSFKNSAINVRFERYYWILNGEKEKYLLTTRDSTGKEKTDTIAIKKPQKPDSKKAKSATDTTKKVAKPKTPKEDSRRTLKFSERDSSTAILDINTFGDGGYKRFYRRSFKKIKEKNAKNLIIDLRANGGGKSDASINLMSYFLDNNYVVYDTLAETPLHSKYNSYFGFPSLMLRYGFGYIFSKKQADGTRQLRSVGKSYKPNKKYHFDGPVYLLTNGGSFSATAIFASMVRHYNKKVVVIGRETGGGSYGCNAMISPYLKLPNTKAQVRMPMFRILLHLPGKDQGRGIMPDYPMEHSFKDVQKNYDVDFEKAYELIKQTK